MHLIDGSAVIMRTRLQLDVRQYPHRTMLRAALRPCRMNSKTASQSVIERLIQSVHRRQKSDATPVDGFQTFHVDLATVARQKPGTLARPGTFLVVTIAQHKTKFCVQLVIESPEP